MKRGTTGLTGPRAGKTRAALLSRCRGPHSVPSGVGIVQDLAFKNGIHIGEKPPASHKLEPFAEAG
jgi:hypothetical protein